MDDTFALVKQCAAEYRALTEAYDAELLKAHNCGHGTAEMDEHLSRAKAIGADVMEALKRYQEAVEELAYCRNSPLANGSVACRDA